MPVTSHADKPENDQPEQSAQVEKSTTSEHPRHSAPTADSTTEDKRLHQRPAFPIVGIGASAGGLQAFEEFFTHMPSDSGMAFVLVQHLDPTQKSILADIISRYTSMQVSQVIDGIPIEPNHVYIIPPNRDMALMQNKLHLIEHTLPRGLRLPIDFFFRSLADELHEHAIGIILSGTGTDGTLGMRAIKGSGGMVMVQDPTSARYDGMPRSAIDTELVDYIEAPQQMPRRLINYTRHEFVSGTRQTTPLLSQSTDALQKIFILLRNQSGHDFSQYKKSTIMRRIERRMAVNQITWINDYIRYLQQNTLELNTLFRALFIGVTSFFRDREAFEALAQHIIPRLFEHPSTQDAIRIWVPGCSTGEEAFSLAILIHEYMSSMRLERQIQIFATDIDTHAIERARTGSYPESIVADVSPERLHYFFRQDNNTYQVKKHIRDMIVFATQSVVKDPPFSNLDLISCRNLLIYLEGELQEKVINLFYRALKQEGFLFLGSSETPGTASSLFRTINRKWQIYQRPHGEATVPPMFDFPMPSVPSSQAEKPNQAKPSINVRDTTERMLLDHYSPPCVVINEQGTILYIHGKTGKYWETPSGQPEWNLFRIARSGLQIPLTIGVRRVMTQHKPVIQEEAHYTTDGHHHSVSITITPIPDSRLLMIVFEDNLSADTAPSPGVPSDPDSDDADDTHVKTLRQELDAARKYLYATNEELQASNEELRSSNEELQSANEELQSSNEELGTSKEELQSVNEELITVNAELQSKIHELGQKNNYLHNLLSNIDAGIIFLDHQLRILWFSPTAKDVVHLIDTDVGRPLHDLVSNIDYNRVIQDAQSVLDTLQTRAAEVRIRDTNEIYWMRITPYRTTENIVEGVIITFTNITQRKQTQSELRQLTRAVEQSSSMIIITDIQANITYVNPRFTALTGYTSEDIIGQNLRTLKSNEEAQELHAQSWQFISAGQQWHGEFQNRKKNGEIYWVSASRAPVWNDTGEITHVIAVEDDITERKVREDTLYASEQLLNSIYTGIEVPIFVIDVTEDRQFLYVGINPASERITGYLRQHIQGKHLHQLDDRLSAQSIQHLHNRFTAVVESGAAIEYEQMATTPNQTGTTWWLTRLEPLKNEQGDVYRIVATSRPITDIKQAEDSLSRHEALLAALGTWWQHLAQQNIDEQYVLQALCRILVQAGPYRAAWVGLNSPGQPGQVRVRAYAEGDGETRDSDPPAWIESHMLPALAHALSQNGQPVVIHHIQTDSIASTWRDMIQPDDITAALAVPCQAKDGISGIILIFADDPAVFTEKNIAIVNILAENLIGGMRIISESHAGSSNEL